MVPKIARTRTATKWSERTPTVLVVDDEPSVGIVLTRLLTAQGCASRRAMCLRDAVAIAEAEPVDAFLIDLSLSGGDSGLDVLAWLRSQERYKDAPVLMFTGQAVLRAADEAFIRQHRASVFYKTDTLRLVVDCVGELLERHA